MIRTVLLPALLLVALVPPALADAPQRPDLLVVLLDDMGWSDLGCYGGEIRTPNIDRLAAGGLRFSAFYNTGRCCPTRAALLTGLYPHQAGVGRMTRDAGLPGYRGQLSKQAVTVAEVLRQAGYRTAMVGKWHLSLTRELPGHMRHLNNQVLRPHFSDPASYPVGRGFDEHYGVIWGVVNYYDPFSLVRNRQAVGEVPEGYYVTDAFTDEAVDIVERYAQTDAPFFLYLAHCAPHWPLHAPEEDIDRYQPLYAQGWEAIRQARYERQLSQGLFMGKQPSLSEPFRDRSWHENPDREWDARAMACHAAMIDRVDQGLGRILDKLVEHNRLDNTLILVLSDNGASREEPVQPGFDRVSQTRDGRDVVYYGGGQPKRVLPGPETTYAGIGPDWANVSNTPFREFKASQFEGGIRTPLVVHWPRGLKTARGSITAATGHVVDIPATLIDVAGAEYPREYEGNEIIELAGKSLRPVFEGRTEDARHDAIYFEHFGARAVLRGRWKLVSPARGEWELYDLHNDPTETRNLADEHPERVEKLAADWQAWAERSQVLPAPGR